jgi:hypothetical protein
MPRAKKPVAVASAVLAFLWLVLLWPLPASAAQAALGAGSEVRPGFRFSLSLAAATPDGLTAGAPFLLPAAGSGDDGERSGRISSTDPQPKPRPLRAWIELGGFLTYSTASYWIRAAFPEDWQFQLNLDDQIRRFFGLQGWRFDSNNFELNWTHSLAGGVYYQFARTSHMSWLYSWMVGLVASTYWEGVVEWKEVISLNDQIMTGIGSYATGEPWYQIGRYLSYQPGLLQQALSFLNPLVKINRWLDRKDPADKAYVQPGWRDFSLFAGARRWSEAGEPSQTGAYFGFDLQLLGLSEYGKSGEIRDKIKDTYFSEISLDYAVRDGHADETRLLTKAVTLGLFRQKIAEDGEGHCLILGLGSAFEYFKKRPLASYDSNPVPVMTGWDDLHLDEPRNFTDKLAILNIAGPVLDWTVFRRGWKLRTVAEAYGDFALVNAYALNEYSRTHDIVGMKTTVFYYGYYYGFGGTFSGRAEFEAGNFRARAQAGFSAWASADGLDRLTDEVTNNVHLSDTRTRCLLGAEWKIPRVPLGLFLTYEGVRRSGKIAEVRVHRLENKTYAGLRFIF